MQEKPRQIASNQQLRKNMRLYIITRVFQKRVFLPLAAIYFTTYAGLSLRTVAILIGWFSLVQILVEVPTGYVADNFGKVKSLRLGAFLNMVASTLYVVSPNAPGIFTAYTLEAIGYSFFGGASEAILHDTLEAQGRVSQYTKIHSRIQSAALAINAVLVAVVPLSYALDPRLPFLIGAVAYGVLLLVNFNIAEVFAPGFRKVEVPLRRRLVGLKKYRAVIPFFLMLGYVSAMYTAPSDFVNLQLKYLGVNPALLGFIFGAASAFGVLVGLIVHVLKRLSLVRYMIFDMLLASSIPIALWANKTFLIIPAVIVTIAFWRYRRIIYQANLLEIFPVREKATLFSVINNSAQVFEFVIPIVFGLIATHYSIPTAFAWSAAVLACVSGPLLLQAKLLKERASILLDPQLS